MNLHNKNILLISPEPWNHIFVSKHHYATYLAKRQNKVFFLNPPAKQTKVIRTEYENVFSVSYSGFIKGLRFLPRVLQKYFINKKFHQLQLLCSIKFDIVWSFDNSVFFDFSALPKEVYCISHIVDLNQDFEFRKAAKTADLALGVIPQIYYKLKSHNPNSFLLGHGVQEPPEEYKRHVLKGSNKIKAIYTGNLQMPHIDWELLLKVVNLHQNVDFIFIGSDNGQSNSKSKVTIFKKQNVYYKTQVKPTDLIQYLFSADILLITYTKEYYQNYATPHKFMEYLASGKMILASWTEEYESLADKSLIKMAKSHDDFLRYFTEIIAGLDYWNRPQKIDRRKIYATNHSYYKQIGKVENLIMKGKSAKNS